MKKIGIDARLYFQTGVGVYIRNLLYYLQRLDLSDVLFYIYLLKGDEDKITFQKENFMKKVADFQWHSVSEQVGFLQTLYKDHLDLMHFTYFGYPMLYKKKFIATVHDTTPLVFKTGKASTKNPFAYAMKYFVFKQVLSSQISNSLAVITPTQAVKEEITKIYGATYESKIHPIHEGINYEFLTIKKKNDFLSKKYAHNFFVYVGNFYPHKNVERLVQAFSNTRKDIKLILVGPKDFFSERLRHSVNRLKQDNRIVFYHAASHEDLTFFYQNAQALIHPSLSEGFGLPLVEAAYYGCPIIASDIPTFREVLGNKYLSFNPYDQHDIAEKIDFFLRNRPKYAYADMIKKFSFKTMAKRTFSLYRSLC